MTLALDDVPYSHFHAWWVCGRLPLEAEHGVGESDALGVSCDCGADGVILNPSPAELRRATKPHRWFAWQRVRLIIGRAGNRFELEGE